MRRILSVLLIAILAGMPLLGMAKQASASAATDQSMQDMSDMPCHQSAPQPDSGLDDGCKQCASASVCCAAFLAPAQVFVPNEKTTAIRIAGPRSLPAGIVIPPLEPPPLAA
jgi:hypothetical protein